MTKDPQHRVRAVLFDLDGTLIDSVPGIHTAVDRSLSEMHGRGCSPDQVRQWVGNGPRVLMQRALDTSDSDSIDAGLQVFERHYAETLYDAVLYPRVAEGLAQLQQAGLSLACLTNKPWPFTQPMLRHLGLEKFFDTVICGDQVERPKPDPQSLLMACDRLDVSVPEALMVGDSANDIQPAQTLGMRSVAVTWGYPGGRSLADFNPALRATRFAEVVAFAMGDPLRT